ncbi:MAG: serine/threonine protein kinase [Gemmataceae bacterium]|nr:serine/threonine protein kinase [Gemmataceae bacterium]
MPDHPTRSHDPAATTSPPLGGLTPTAPDDHPAVPEYDLLEEVGSGGMGVVYRARDLALDREVAVKLLLPKYAPASAVAARFVDEARITAQLQHPGVPAVYRVGALADGRPFLAMKLIKGRTLADLLAAEARSTADAEPLSGPPPETTTPQGADAPRSGARDPRPPKAVDPLAVFEAVCQAVGYAHAHGVVHRDLKPQNVMVGSFGEVQVMDWGLAKVLAGGGRQSPEPSDPEATTAPTEIRTLRDSDGSFTQAGSVLGTPAYMPPEQAAGEAARVGPRSDVFGLGGLLCVLLTGQPPLDGADPEGVRVNAIRGRTEAAFARLDACGADPDVITLCKRCLAFDPADRPASADEVAAAVAGPAAGGRRPGEGGRARPTRGRGPGGRAGEVAADGGAGRRDGGSRPAAGDRRHHLGADPGRRAAGGRRRGPGTRGEETSRSGNGAGGCGPQYGDGQRGDPVHRPQGIPGPPADGPAGRAGTRCHPAGGDRQEASGPRHRLQGPAGGRGPAAAGPRQLVSLPGGLPGGGGASRAGPGPLPPASDSGPPAHPAGHE